ncbi:MAG: tagaturonate reductase [Bacteroidota bacterium]
MLHSRIEKGISLEQLSKQFIARHPTLPGVTIGSINQMPERVLQFGEGNFLRAFVDWQFNELIKQGKFNGRVVVVQPLESGMVDQLTKQDSLYTLVQRGYQDGTLVEKIDIITAISRGINPYKEYTEFLKCAANPDLRYVFSNTTESGITYIKTEKPKDSCPASFPAKVAILLFERFRKFQGDISKGLIIIPCELIDKNGDILKQCILQHAVDWNCGGEFIDWVNNHNYFYNTLVDRIVPGYPKDEIGELTEKLGYQDNLLVACEVFHKWVIQGDPIAKKELKFTDAGLNVIWTDTITPHRTLKVRILNGAHTTFAIPAFLDGKTFVKESMDNSVIGKFISESVFEEILPTLEYEQQEKVHFAHAVLERFRNPFIRHELISITLNSVSKYKVRVLPSLISYHQQTSQIAHRLCFGLSALIRFYKPVSRSEKGYVGEYAKKQYPIRDSNETVEFFDSVWKRHRFNYYGIALDVLANQKFWERDLNTIEGLTDSVAFQIASIEENGIQKTIQRLQVQQSPV